MTKKPVRTKFIAVATAMATMVVMCGMPAFAFAADGDNAVTKDETVYVVTNSDGAEQDVIVSDHLINKDGIKTIADETTLSDIENVKGDETFQQNGDSLRWDAEGNGIYYQGTPSDEIPVTMDIVYRLDGKVVSAPELQGKSGNVEIKINYENTAKYEGSTVPFIVMTALIITDDSFKDVKISEGKVIDDGDKQLVVGMAAPGLAQSLDLAESDLGIGSSITITGVADEFGLEDMMTLVTNSFFEDIDTDAIDDLDYDDQIDELDNGAKKLMDGSKLLYEGIDTLSSKMPDLEDGIGDLKDGADTLNSGTKQAKKGAEDLAAGSQQLKDLPGSLATMDQGLTQLKQVAAGMDKGLGDVKTGIDNADTALSNVEDEQLEIAQYLGTLDAFYASLSDSQKEMIKVILGEKYGFLVSDLDEVADNAKIVYGTIDGVSGEDVSEENPMGTGLKKASNSIGANDAKGTLLYYGNILEDNLADMETKLAEQLPALQKGIPTLIGGSSQLANAEAQLSGGAQQLADGMAALQDNSNTLIGGVDKIDKASLELSDGMAKLYKEGIKKIVDLYNDELKGTLDSVDGVLDAGKGYKSFTKLPSNMDGSVKFIYRTDLTK